MDILKSPDHRKSASTTGLKTVVAILEQWRASVEQGTAILRVSKSTYARAKHGEAGWEVTLDSDQLARASFVLNIHAALRVIFDNPANLYGFMRMANHNPFFNGRAPLQVMGNGDFMSIYETFRRIDALRDAQW